MQEMAMRLPRAARFLLAAAVLMVGSYGVYRLRAANSLYEPTFLETVEASKTSYAPGETVLVRGDGFAPSSTVTLRVTLPDGSEVIQAGKTDESGVLTFSYTPGPLNGRYVVDVLGSNDLGLSGTALTYGPTVAADRGDYRPGERAVLTGTHFLPGETVELRLHQALGDRPDVTLWAPADGNGNFTNSDYVLDGNPSGTSSITVTATGLSSGYATQAVFTASAV